MRISKHINIANIILVLLFISTIVVGFIFVGTDIEYNLNQQIARGYISREAVFFNLDNPAYKQLGIVNIVVDDSGNIIDSYSTSGELEFDENGAVVIPDDIEAENADFVLENKTYSDGFTAVEKMISSGKTDYFASLHRGILRGIYYQGNVDLPPISSGRFINSDECLNNYPVAVIGKNYVEYMYSKDNKQYFEYLNREYEVVGVTGLSGSSPLDSIIFVNIGSLNSEEQLDGIFYIDSSTDNISVYENFCNQSQNLFGCNLKQRDIPIAQIDTISGGMYLKKYLKVIMTGLLLFTFANILVQTLRKEHGKIAVMKILGISNLKILLSISLRNIIRIIIGILLGLMIVAILIIIEYFSLPMKLLLSLSANLIVISLIMMLVWVFISEAVIILTNPHEVIQRL